MCDEPFIHHGFHAAVGDRGDPSGESGEDLDLMQLREERRLIVGREAFVQPRYLRLPQPNVPPTSMARVATQEDRSPHPTLPLEWTS